MCWVTSVVLTHFGEFTCQPALCTEMDQPGRNPPVATGEFQMWDALVGPSSSMTGLPHRIYLGSLVVLASCSLAPLVQLSIAK